MPVIYTKISSRIVGRKAIDISVSNRITKSVFNRFDIVADIATAEAVVIFWRIVLIIDYVKDSKRRYFYRLCFVYC